MMTKTEALAKGYQIDHYTTGRPLAYRGPRYQPIEYQKILTDLEEKLVGALEKTLDAHKRRSTGFPLDHETEIALEEHAENLIAKVRETV